MSLVSDRLTPDVAQPLALIGLVLLVLYVIQLFVIAPLYTISAWRDLHRSV